MMRSKLAAVIVLAAFTAVFVTAPALPLSAQGQENNGQPRANNGQANNTTGLLVPFTGQDANGNAVTGTFKITSFEADRANNQVLAVGTLVATATDNTGTRSIVTQASWPVQLTNGTTKQTSTRPAPSSGVTVRTIANTRSVAMQTTGGSCNILHLVLGPLSLNLLGLQVNLNQVVLDITAQQGSGNLLGNLLCAVANLLNPGGPLQNTLNQLVALLNQILAAL